MVKKRLPTKGGPHKKKVFNYKNAFISILGMATIQMVIPYPVLKVQMTHI